VARPSRELSVAPGRILRCYAQPEAEALAARWWEAFGAGGEIVSTRRFLWEVFSGGDFPSLRGGAALIEYAKQELSEYVVLSNDRSLAFATDWRPESCSLYDYLVFPSNLEWTMAFTHEAGWLGPYFAFHRNARALHRENAGLLTKSRQSEAARRRGWQ